MKVTRCFSILHLSIPTTYIRIDVRSLEMINYKTKYRIVLQNKNFYLQKKVGLFRTWEYIMVQTNVGNYRPWVCETWDLAVTRLNKYIADHKSLEGVPITASVEIKGGF